MKVKLKRYGMALAFLFFVVLLMMIGTFGVEMFGEKMSQDMNITMHPKGERL